MITSSPNPTTEGNGNYFLKGNRINPWVWRFNRTKKTAQLSCFLTWLTHRLPQRPDKATVISLKGIRGLSPETFRNKAPKILIEHKLSTNFLKTDLQTKTLHLDDTLMKPPNYPKIIMKIFRLLFLPAGALCGITVLPHLQLPNYLTPGCISADWAWHAAWAETKPTHTTRHQTTQTTQHSKTQNVSPSRLFSCQL